MPSILTKVALFFLTGALGSCTYITTSKLNNPALLQQAKKFHVVRHENSTRDIDKYLSQALKDRSLQTTTGTAKEMPADTEVYVEYVDRWYWDIVMYLRKLDISFHDARSGATIGKAKFRHVPLLHSFPNPENKTEQMVKRIYKASAAAQR